GLGGEPGGHDLAVGLDGHASGLVKGAGEVGGNHAAAAETGVEAAVAVVAGQSEVAAGAALEGEAGGDDLAVTLDGNSSDRADEAGVVRDDLAAAAESGVEAAVGVVAGQSGAGAAVARVKRLARLDDLAVGLDGSSANTKIGRGTEEIRRHLAAGAEGCVEGACRRYAAVLKHFQHETVNGPPMRRPRRAR